MKIIAFLMMSLLWAGNALADDCGPFGCMFTPGTICVNGKCVPRDTPTTTTIKPALPFLTTTTTQPSISTTTTTIKPTLPFFTTTTVQPTTTTTTTLPGSFPIKIKQSHIQQKAVPLAAIVPMELSCRKYDSLHLVVDLFRLPPSKNAYFYSAINYPDRMYVAKQDIYNNYVFVKAVIGEKVSAQSHGRGLVFFLWRNPAFGDILRLTPCSDWVDDKVIFTYGISYKEDVSDFEGASFKFVP